MVSPMRYHHRPPAPATLTSMLTTIALGALAVVAFVLPAGGHPRLAVHEQRTLELDVPFDLAPDAARALQVSNLCGSVEISTHRHDRVTVEVDETIRARTRSDLERAKRETRLSLREQPGRVQLIADGPFRQADGSIQWRERSYRVCYDLAIRVPARINLDVSTITDGTVTVRGTEGDLVAENVNGALQVLDVAGSGALSNVNGDISLTVRARPDQPWSIETVNGDVDAQFPASLEADLSFETMHGEIFTDYEVTPLPAPVTKGERRADGLFVYRQEPAVYARVGSGGPAIDIETLNGDIFLRRLERAAR